MKGLLAGLVAAGALVVSGVSATAGAATSKATHFNCVVSCSAYEATINRYFTDVAAANGATDNVYSVATQYSGIQYDETFGGSYVDGNPYPTTKTCRDGFDTYCVTKPQLEAEIK